jgi:hypothetical protein
MNLDGHYAMQVEKQMNVLLLKCEHCHFKYQF